VHPLNSFGKSGWMAPVVAVLILRKEALLLLADSDLKGWSWQRVG
jgi:hypothetical protein